MDSLRTYAITALTLLLVSSTASSTPVDTTWDLLDAVECRNGERFLDLMSESLRLQIELNFQQLKDMMEEDPGLVETLLRESGMGLTTWDLEWMTEADFISRLLEKVNLPPLDNITSEEVSMTGRNAEVVFTWYSGYSLLIQFTWEESSWKVTGSPVIDQLF